MVILDKLAALISQNVVDSMIPSTLSKKQAEETAKKVDVFTTKVLGVLQEQGVYAAILFLFSRFGEDTEGKTAQALLVHLLRLLGNSELGGLGAAYQGVDFNDQSKDWTQWAQSNRQNILRHFAEGVNGSEGVATNLQRLLAVKSLFEQTLIYVRYGAKAL